MHLHDRADILVSTCIYVYIHVVHITNYFTIHSYGIAFERISGFIFSFSFPVSVSISSNIQKPHIE